MLGILYPPRKIWSLCNKAVLAFIFMFILFNIYNSQEPFNFDKFNTTRFINEDNWLRNVLGDKSAARHGSIKTGQEKTSILCWVMTTTNNIPNKGIHVMNTWGRRCDKFVFASDHLEPGYPSLNITVEHGRNHLTAKTMAAFDEVWRRYPTYSWYVKADDDTYFIMDNLRYFLSNYSSSEKHYFGEQLKIKRGRKTIDYHSGGAGYVISHAALAAFGKRPGDLCRNDFGAEDVEFGLCMQKLNVPIDDSRDAEGLVRFICIPPLTVARGNVWWTRQKWIVKYPLMGLHVLSPHVISFHYVDRYTMHQLEFLTHTLRVHGYRT